VPSSYGPRQTVHAGNGREVHLAGVPNVKVDEYCKDTKSEHLGRFWQRCFCLPSRHKLTGKTQDTLHSRYEETMVRLKRVEDAGYKVVSTWGCEFQALLQDNPGLEKELKSYPLIRNSTLNIRDAFYGGRTDATNMWYKVTAGEQVHYVDVISLYPYTCKYGKFPIAHPKCTQVMSVHLTLAREEVIKCKDLPVGRCSIPSCHTRPTPNSCFHCVPLVLTRCTRATVHILMRNGV
jgi:G:T-mismatch repair DNA endonuclease (very short patch repair protein)